MDKWPLRIVCAFSLFSSGMRQFDSALNSGSVGMALFWGFGGAISFLLAVIVLVQGVR